MKRYTKNINGQVISKFRNQIVINKNGKQILCPSEKTLLEDGWVEYKQPELSEEQKLVNAKVQKNAEIKHYDASDAVNIFYIQDVPVWLDKATRAGLKLRFDAELAAGKTETSLWYKNMQFPLKLDVATQILYNIEIYASACYDNTQQHLANINALTTIDEVENYDHTSNYPEKLKF